MIANVRNRTTNNIGDIRTARIGLITNLKIAGVPIVFLLNGTKGLIPVAG
jgi:hypothetical protein